MVAPCQGHLDHAMKDLESDGSCWISALAGKLEPNAHGRAVVVKVGTEKPMYVLVFQVDAGREQEKDLASFFELFLDSMAGLS